MGIFRLPGQASRILFLKELYDSGSQEDFSDTEDVHTVASLLKLYLRELPEPVVPYLFYDSYKQALEGNFIIHYTYTLVFKCIMIVLDHFAKESGKEAVSEDEGLENLKRLLIQLPADNFNVLKYLRYIVIDVGM